MLLLLLGFIVLGIVLFLIFKSKTMQGSNRQPVEKAPQPSSPKVESQQPILIEKTQAEILGQEGEQLFIQQYQQAFTLPYVLLNNCTFTDAKNGTTQVDHIILSLNGIFVIELKNYSGWVFGKKDQKQWTQIVYQKKYQFQNPLRQNYKHIKVLENILADLVEFKHLNSLVIFTEKSEFKTEMPNNVLQGRAWIDYVKQARQPIFSTLELQVIHSRLEQARLADNADTDYLHVQNLRNKRPTI